MLCYKPHWLIRIYTRPSDIHAVPSILCYSNYYNLFYWQVGYKVFALFPLIKLCIEFSLILLSDILLSTALRHAPTFFLNPSIRQVRTFSLRILIFWNTVKPRKMPDQRFLVLYLPIQQLFLHDTCRYLWRAGNPTIIFLLMNSFYTFLMKCLASHGYRYFKCCSKCSGQSFLILSNYQQSNLMNW